MYINIYFGDKPVILCDEINKELNEILHHPDAVFVDEISPRAIKSMLHEIKKDEFHAGVLWHTDLDKLKATFFKNFKIIEAAGGIVQNDKKEILFINRLGKWDLPKGKIEKGEKEEVCALREVTEETGVKDLQLKKKVGETYHVYDEFGKHFLKNIALVSYDMLIKTGIKTTKRRTYHGNKMGEDDGYKRPIKKHLSFYKKYIEYFF